ncbi:MAG: sigma 54-interacting transcriptional regulator [Bacillota bacterium]
MGAAVIADTKVKEVMTREVYTLPPQATIAEAAAIFKRKPIDGIPITDDGRVVGMVTKSHILNGIVDGLGWDKPVKHLMARDILCIDPDRSVYEICLLPVKRLPVVDRNQKLLGMITKTDLMRVFSGDVRYVKERLSTIIESTHNGIIAVSIDGRVITHNSSASRILGLEATSAMGKHIDEVFPESGLLTVIATGRAETGVQVSLGKRTLLCNRTPLIKNDEVIGAVGVFQDISELEAISRQLDSFRKLSNQLHAIIESSYDGICVASSAGSIEQVNSAYERLMGVSKEEVLGKTIGEDLVGKVRMQRMPVTLMQRTATGKDVLVTGSPIFNEDGHLCKVVTNVRDMTELGRLKRELEISTELQQRYSTELSLLRGEHLNSQVVLTEHSCMKGIIEMALRVAAFDSTVLILGETGVGKEVIAKMIHDHSARKDGPFIKVNCAAIPETLLESELFGYAPGAFTGASRAGKPGMFELAKGGTIFLDEIAELPLSLQAKLLRVLQEQEVFKVGGVSPQKIDVRVLAASNKDLEKMVEAGAFRNDLYYRLNVIPLTVPPLRDHKEDIPLLAHTYLQRFNSRYRTDKRLSPGAVDQLCEYSWPGNIRELAHTLERLVIMTKGEAIEAGNLPKAVAHAAPTQGLMVGTCPALDVGPLKEAIGEFEQALISKAIQQQGSIRKAAKVLEIDPSTVLRKMRRSNGRQLSGYEA